MTSVTRPQATDEPAVAPEAARFPALDGLRGLAALAVVATHVGFNSGRSIAGGWLGSTLARLDFGVAVFFLLSGFLLYRPFALHLLEGRPLPSIRAFLVRRVARILPAVWLMTAVTLGVITTYVVHPVDWASYLTLVQVYNHHDYDPNLTHLWTLSVELSFYALIPVLAGVLAAVLALLGRRGQRLGRGPGWPVGAVRAQLVMLGTLVAVQVTFNLLVGHHVVTHSQALLWLPGYLDWFAAGMALAVLTCLPPDRLGRVGGALRDWAGAPGTCFLVAAVLFAIAALPLGVPRTLAPATAWQWTLQHELFLAAAFMVMLPLVAGPAHPVHRALGSWAGRELGALSYGIYLWHVPLMIWIQRRAGFEEFRGHFWALLALTVTASVLVAAVSWYAVERPIVRYAARRTRRRPSPTNTAASAATQSS